MRKREKPTESNSWCWFVGVWFTNVNKECCVSSTVISAQPWYGDDSPHLPPWIWNRTHHRGVWLPVLATHTNQNLVYNTESARLRPPVIDQLNGYMSAPFQPCGIPLLSFVWPLYRTSKLTWVDLMITRTTTTNNQQMAGSQTSHFSIFVDLKPKNEVGRRKFGENASIFLNSWPQSSWWIQGLDRR